MFGKRMLNYPGLSSRNGCGLEPAHAPDVPYPDPLQGDICTLYRVPLNYSHVFTTS